MREAAQKGIVCRTLSLTFLFPILSNEFLSILRIDMITLSINYLYVQGWFYGSKIHFFLGYGGWACLTF